MNGSASITATSAESGNGSERALSVRRLFNSVRRLALATAMAIPVLLGLLGTSSAHAAVSTNCTGPNAQLVQYDVHYYSVGGIRCNNYTKIRVLTKKNGVLIDDYTQPGYQQPWDAGSVGAHLFIPQHGAAYQTVAIAYLWNGSGWVQDSYWTTGTPRVLS